MAQPLFSPTAAMGSGLQAPFLTNQGQRWALGSRFSSMPWAGSRPPPPCPQAAMGSGLRVVLCAHRQRRAGGPSPRTGSDGLFSSGSFPLQQRAALGWRSFPSSPTATNGLRPPSSAAAGSDAVGARGPSRRPRAALCCSPLPAPSCPPGGRDGFRSLSLPAGSAELRARGPSPPRPQQRRTPAALPAAPRPFPAPPRTAARRPPALPPLSRTAPPSPLPPPPRYLRALPGAPTPARRPSPRGSLPPRDGRPDGPMRRGARARGVQWRSAGGGGGACPAALRAACCARCGAVRLPLHGRAEPQRGENRPGRAGGGRRPRSSRRSRAGRNAAERGRRGSGRRGLGSGLRGRAGPEGGGARGGRGGGWGAGGGRGGAGRQRAACGAAGRPRPGTDARLGAAGSARVRAVGALRSALRPGRARRCAARGCGRPPM